MNPWKLETPRLVAWRTTLRLTPNCAASARSAGKGCKAFQSPDSTACVSCSTTCEVRLSGESGWNCEMLIMVGGSTIWPECKKSQSYNGSALNLMIIIPTAAGVQTSKEFFSRKARPNFGENATGIFATRGQIFFSYINCVVA